LTANPVIQVRRFAEAAQNRFIAIWLVTMAQNRPGRNLSLN